LQKWGASPVDVTITRKRESMNRKNLLFDIATSIASVIVLITLCIYLPASFGGYVTAMTIFFVILFLAGWLGKRFVK
jgi:hypothetical protein